MATPAAPTTSTAPGGFSSDDLAAIKAKLLSGGGAGTGTTDYIGYPSNTSTLQGIGGVDAAHPQPLYQTGSEWIPVRENATPAEISQLQDRMVAAGLLSNSDYRAGVWDAPSQEAFKQILGLANASGSTWQDALTQYTNSAPMAWNSKTNSYVKGTAGTARTNATLVTNFTNPDDLAATANEVAVNKIGRIFTPDEMQRFVRAYHDTEASVSAGQAAAGGSYTQAPSPDVAAAGFAQQTDPTAYNAEQFLPLVQKMNQMLSGPGLATTKPMSA